MSPGGSLSSLFNIAGGTGNISGGNFGEFLIARGGSEVNITGGDFSDNPFSPFPAVQPTTITATTNATIEISGGIFGGNLLNANNGGEVNLLGTEFFFNGVEIDSLQPDMPFLIAGRDGALSGTLLDGSSFDFFLGTSDIDSTTSTVTVSTVSAVPEPSGLALLLAGGVVGLLVRRRD